MTIYKNKRIIGGFTTTIVLIVLVFLLVATKQVQAQGFGASFDITLKDIERRAGEFKKKYGKYGEFAFQALRKRYLVQIQNDLVNWVQGNGEPKFIKNPGEFLENNFRAASATQIDKFFLERGADICSPFKANVKFLVTKPLLLRQETVRCSLGDIVGNLKNFAENFENGGWTTWLKLHETRNTLPGTYLAATELIGADIARSGNAAQAQISAGKGFLDQKKCLKIKFPKYVLDFVVDASGINYTFPIGTLELLNRVLAADTSSEWTDTDLWLEITSIPIGNVLPESIEIINTGEFITKDYNPGDPVPPGATCTQEETITPGSTVGEWVTQGLLKGSIDTIINADELGQIVNAVIDAYINKIARDGLSKVKSGRGSWTTPGKTEGGTYANLDQVKIEQLGFESPEATSLLNRLLGFQNRASQLITQINSLTRDEDQAESFKTKLENQITAARLGDNDPDTGGINLGGNEDELDDIIARLYSRRHFNEESRNPGPYVANKVFHEVIGDLWENIEEKLKELEQPANTQIPNNCAANIPDIRFYTSPRQEALPFTDGDGKVTVWRLTEDLFPYTNFLDLLGDNAVKSTTPEIWKRDYLTVKGLIEAESIKNLNKNLAETYTGLIANSKQDVETFQADLSAIASSTPALSKYVSLLTDYDRAARDTGAIGTMQNYAAALNSNDEIELNTLRTDLLTSQYEARERWYSNQQAVVNDPITSPTELAKQAEKLNIISVAINKIEFSLRELAAQNPEQLSELAVPVEPAYVISGMPITEVINLISLLDSIDFIKNGKSVSAAVAETLNLDIDNIESDLEQRESRVNSYASEVTNVIGNFLTKADQDEFNNIGEKQKELGVTGGDSEWEKYYKNRFQLAYAALIYDFYANRFECP